MEQISAAAARMLALRSQGLVGSPYPVTAKSVAKAKPQQAAHAVSEVLHHLGAIQLDTISVLARSHELVPYARLGAVGRTNVETALWGSETEPTTFEYWSHAACVLPIDMFPWFAWRRRSYVRRGVRWHDVPSKKTLNSIKKQLADNSLNTTDLGGAKKSGYWWDWSDAKVGVEWLLDIGEVVCTQRIGWRRMYALTENVIPSQHLHGASAITKDGVTGPSDDECLKHLFVAGLDTLGVGTFTDITDVHRLGSPHVDKATMNRILNELVESGDVSPIAVSGWNEPAYISADALTQLDLPKSKSRTTLLSPFDSLVWNRDRMERIFDMRYRIEAYTPEAKRIYGYFAMPVLHDGKLVARVDPGRIGKGANQTLVAKHVAFELDKNGKVPATAVTGTAQALREAATWVNAIGIQVDRVTPPSAKKVLVAALA